MDQQQKPNPPSESTQAQSTEKQIISTKKNL